MVYLRCTTSVPQIRYCYTMRAFWTTKRLRLISQNQADAVEKDIGGYGTNSLISVFLPAEVTLSTSAMARMNIMH